MFCSHDRILAQVSLIPPLATIFERFFALRFIIDNSKYTCAYTPRSSRGEKIEEDGETWVDRKQTDEMK